MPRRNLTNKQKCVLDLEARGIDRNDAVLQCYDAKDRANAYQIGFKLSKHELYQKELKKQKDLVELIKLDEGKKFADILRELIKPREVANILKELINSSDTRAKLQAVQEYNKVLSHYPDAKVGIYRDYEKERERILTTPDLLKLPETKEPVIEQGKTAKEERK
ncbi:MAG: hypothetical protein ACKKMW_02075 [Candidatus Nealsonbacteria bacterium]